MRFRLVCAAVLAIAQTPAYAQAKVDEYRALLADNDANPAFLWINRGEELFKRKAGPRTLRSKAATSAWAPAFSKAPMPSCRATLPTPDGCRTSNRGC